MRYAGYCMSANHFPCTAEPLKGSDSPSFANPGLWLQFTAPRFVHQKGKPYRQKTWIGRPEIAEVSLDGDTGSVCRSHPGINDSCHDPYPVWKGVSPDPLGWNRGRRGFFHHSGDCEKYHQQDHFQPLESQDLCGHSSVHSGVSGFCAADRQERKTKAGHTQGFDMPCPGSSMRCPDASRILLLSTRWGTGTGLRISFPGWPAGLWLI